MKIMVVVVVAGLMEKMVKNFKKSTPSRFRARTTKNIWFWEKKSTRLLCEGTVKVSRFLEEFGYAISHTCGGRKSKQT